MKVEKGTYVVNLKNSKEDIFSKVQKDNRWSVRKAQKIGVKIKEGGDKNIAYKLYLDVCKTNLLIPNSKKVVFSQGKMFGAYHKGKLVAFSIVREDKKKAILSYNGSDYKFRDTQANVLLYWEVMMNYKKKGFESFDLGGVDLHSKYRRSNDRFKERWGGDLVRTTQNVDLISYMWWKYLRHYRFIQKLKYNIQTSILKRK